MAIAGRLLAAMLVAAACSPSSAPAASPSADAPVRGGRIVVALLNDITSLDPLLISDGGQYDRAGPVTSQLYDTLAIADRRTGEIVPRLATWTLAADGRTYDFDIAANAVWSDGQPIVAQDFITAMRAVARSQKAASRPGVMQIEGFTDYRQGKATTISGLRADGRHLTVRFGVIFCAALNVPLLTPPLPTHVFGKYLSDVDLTKNTDDAPEHSAPAVTSGPFVFSGWRHGEEIVLRANPRYWNGAPFVDELAFRIIDRSALRGALQNASVDVAFATLQNLDFDTLRVLDRDASVRVIRAPAPGYSFIGWNTRSQSAPALQDKRIRQALAYGLDADLAVRQILQGEGGRMNQHMQPTSWAYASGLNSYPYDPAKAESLIQSAGYTKGPDGIYQKDGHALAFTIITNDNNTVRSPVVQFAADQYRAIGVRVTPTLTGFNSLADRLFAGDQTIEAFVLGWVVVGDLNPVPIWHSPTQSAGVPQNLAGYTNADLDKALDEGRFGPDCSLAARKRAYDTFNRILNEDQPYDFLYWQNEFVITSSRLRGLTPGTYVPLPDAHLWWLAPRR